MMLRVLRAELAKLNGSLALLLAIVVPGLLGILPLLALLANDRTSAWTSILHEFVLPLWAFFMLPMAVTAFTTLVAQIEYRGRSWDHLLALPIARWRIFTAKAIVVLLAVSAMTVLVVLFAIAGAAAGGWITGRMPTGAIPWTMIVRSASMIVGAGACFVILQLWVALRYANFVVPLAVGIGGTLIAIAAMMTRSDRADWFPWVLPFKAITDIEPSFYLLVGLVGGIVALGCMLLDLNRRALH